MNFDLLTAVLKSKLPCAQRMILTVVLNHAGQDNRAWPSHPTIAAQAGLAERSVWAHLRDLEASGWLRNVGKVGRVVVWEVTNPANSAGSIPQPLRDTPETIPQPLPEIPQILRDAEKPIPQILRDNPATVAGHPANSARQSRKICELTTQEPLNNQSGTTHRADEPPEGSKAKPAKPDWRTHNREQATAANAIRPDMLAPADFRQAWNRWAAYRTARAVDARIASEAVAWTVAAAEAGLRDCHRAATAHGWPAVLARIDAAIAGNWQGFNFDSMRQPQRGNAPRRGAFDQSRMTEGLTADQIGTL